MELSQIKGLGAKRIQKLAEAGIDTPARLLLRFPVRYIDATRINDFSAADGGELVIRGRLIEAVKPRYIRKGLSLVRAGFDCGGTRVDASFFNQSFVAKALKVGQEYILYGRCKRFKSSVSLSAPRFLYCTGIVPVYPKLSGLPAKVLEEAVEKALDGVRISGYLDEELRVKHGLMPLNDAVRELHRPQSFAELKSASDSVAVENLTYQLSVYALLKKSTAGRRGFAYADNRTALARAVEGLPYTLTQGQSGALDDIIGSLHADRRMNRLLAGDVGCGKTVVAMLAMYYASLSGVQSVMMAPTELLARQHYATAIRLFEPLGVKCELLCASVKEKRRAEALFNIENGAEMVFGTHSLLGDAVKFSRLGLIVTDEQHRFGVNQRAYLENKSEQSDCLVMSATPIPRTLALTLYGDLEVSQIRTLPPKKATTKTKLVPARKTGDMLDYIKKKAEAGEQTYIVCPRVADEDDGLLSVEELYARLKKSMAGYAGILNGQMRDTEKNAVMERFARGELKVLVCTTVVEVGLDVKNATTMVIFNAERYGLSQLHQLRGRVGRGEKDSYCFLLYEGEAQSAIERLNYFCSVGDGFELAQYDFEARGAGDFLGTRQHGESAVKITPAIVERAKTISDELLCDGNMCEKILASVNEGNENYIKNITLN